MFLWNSNELEIKGEYMYIIIIIISITTSAYEDSNESYNSQRQPTH